MEPGKHRKRRLGAICSAVLFGFAGIVACGSDDADTTTTQAETTTTQAETTTTQAETTTTQAETTTAVTTGLTRWYLVDGLLMHNGAMVFENEPLVVVGSPSTPVTGWLVHVTMDGGSTPMMIPAEGDIVNEIWPDGVAAEGVRVTIEKVAGEERVTGRVD